MIAFNKIFCFKSLSASNESRLPAIWSLIFVCVLSFALSAEAAPVSSEWSRYCKAGLKSMKAHNYSDAERAFQDALERAERDHEPVEIRLECLSNLGKLYAEKKNYSKAASTFNRAVALAEKEFPRAGLAEDDFDVYVADVRRRVRRAWIPPKDETASAVIIVFTTHQDGHIDHPSIIQSSGSELVDSSAVKGILDASPFECLPLGSPKSIVIKLKLDPRVDLVPQVAPSPIGKFRNF